MSAKNTPSDVVTWRIVSKVGAVAQLEMGMRNKVRGDWLRVRRRGLWRNNGRVLGD